MSLSKRALTAALPDKDNFINSLRVVNVPTEGGPSSVARYESPFRCIAVFNSKGGVGKSTLSLLASLGSLVRRPTRTVEVIDLDRQQTTRNSLIRFAGENFLFPPIDEFTLAGSRANNGVLGSYVSGLRGQKADRLVVIDCPAGMVPQHSTFLEACDLIITPLAPSDADIFATSACVGEVNDMFGRQGYGEPRPPILLLPNVVDSGSEVAELRRAVNDAQAYFGRALPYNPLFRRAFRADFEDRSVLGLVQSQIKYIDWLLDVIQGSPMMDPLPKRLRLL